MDVSPHFKAMSFADCVRECARDEKIIAAFNALHDAQLTAPIGALLNNQPLPDPRSDEALRIAWFLGFIHLQIWGRVLRARERGTWPTQLEQLRQESVADATLSA